MATFPVRVTVEYDFEVEAENITEAEVEARYAALDNGMVSPTSTSVEVIL